MKKNMNKQQFIDMYVCTFLASYKAHNYDSNISIDPLRNMHNSSQIEEALFLAHDAWKIKEEYLNGNSNYTSMF